MSLPLLFAGIVIFLLGYAAGRLSASIDYPKPERRPLPGPGEPLEPAVVLLARRGRRLAAIRRFRRVYGTDSATAKAAVDALSISRGQTP